MIRFMITMSLLYTSITLSLVYIGIILSSRFPGEKVHTMDSAQDGLLVLRTVGSQKLRKITFREVRPHMIAESVSYELDSEDVSVKSILA